MVPENTYIAIKKRTRFRADSEIWAAITESGNKFGKGRADDRAKEHEHNLAQTLGDSGG